MEYILLAIALVLFLLVIFIKGALDERKANKLFMKKIKQDYGKRANKNYSTAEYESISKAFRYHQDEDSIDDITFNDIGLDDIFQFMDHSLSSTGAEYLYYRLRTPAKSEEETIQMEEKINFFQENEEARLRMQSEFAKIGSTRKFSLYDTLEFLAEIPRKNLFTEYLKIILFFASIVWLCVQPSTGILALIGVALYNIVTYYRERGEIEKYIISFSFIINLIRQSKKIEEIDIPVLKEEYDVIRKYRKEMNAFTRNSGIVTSKSVNAVGSGNPLEILVDYARMVFHLDIIKFYKMASFIQDKQSLIDGLFMEMGKVESYICIARFRASLPTYCIPKKGSGLEIINAYHPLIENPVKNSIVANRGVLITGSNASGKSTFLKTVALNVVLAQTIHTCVADSYQGEWFSLFTSMSLKDDLASKDSYFMAEIKALKRIIDYSQKNPDKKILCFVDEVLRGTNTVERIAASTQILRTMGEKNLMCFAATHDIELTDLLKDCYDNYHFDETVENNDVIFNYMIKPGKATSRNAIMLLSIMGFSDDIISKAKSMAEHFSIEGRWKV